MNMRSMWAIVLGISSSCVSASVAAQHPAAAGTTQATRTDVALDVLSDSGGVDLNPYFEHLVGALQKRWQPLILQAEPNAPAVPQETVIELTILPDGELGAMRLDGSTQDKLLTRAAWAATQGITYPSPPAGMRDAALKLRLHFKVK